MVFMIAVLIAALFVAWGALWPDAMSAATQSMLGFTITHFGWFYLLAVFGFLLFAIYLAFGRFGSIRLGGEDAEPQFSRLSWFSMLFAAGMGIGLVFWGAAEPLAHYATPPVGEALTPDAARNALRFTFFHWGLHPWAIYGVMGLAIAYFSFNRNLPVLISEAFRPLFGQRVSGSLGRAIDVLAVLATACGVVTSLGLGTLQIAGGLRNLFGLPDSDLLHVVIILVAVGAALLSSLTGVERGIKWLSNANVALALLLLAFVVACGPTLFIVESMTTTLGSYLHNLAGMSLRLTPFSQGTWVADWTLFYWAWWITWAPFVGIFIARVSKGRTIREFVMGVLLAPTLFSFIWFAAFGGTALHQQMFHSVDLLAVQAHDYSETLFALLQQLPLRHLASGVALVLIACFFVTSADSATFVLGMLSARGNHNPPARTKVIWGVVMAAMAIVLLFTGGLKALQTLSIVAALPFAVVMVGLCVALYKALNEDDRSRQLRERERRHAVDRLLRQGAEPPPG
ncbi:BCCT family transporter [Chitiniphilus shinanonensis]|uniref:BCCT family transporter n=1 Tax=Chitiniphilus shinanonensis TaxID=553088 RepID=F8WSN6_9NEIS|nr:BCCT family transporter [Chitiniphilus shinanonensis]BAK53873.1 glycine betaine transporter [Chitiniphilus shinanonensis]GLS05986.1 BCCT family transporter [Chitiniphilus shinanonensis]